MIGRAATRLLDAPRFGPEEAGLKAAVDALGGEVIRLRSRDGLKLTGRWLPSDSVPTPGDSVPGGGSWQPDPYEAILLLHGWTGSVAPDLVELGPTLRRTAGVLGLDFRGHGGSDDAPTSFGLHEVEDVAGALAWFGERGIRRVALVGSSMGGIVAIASIVVLGDGSLPQADLDPMAPAADVEPPRPRIVGAVVESVAPDLRIPIANRMGLPIGGVFRRALAGRMFTPSAEHWEVPGAEHGEARRAAPAQWDERVSAFLRSAFSGAREGVPIIHASGEPTAISDSGVEGD